MKRLLSTFALVALGTAGLGGLGPVAEAGEAPAPAPSPADFVVVYEASGDQAEEIIDAITPELFESDGTTAVTGCIGVETNAGQSLTYTCPSLPTGFPTGIDYVIGISGVPDTARVEDIFCTDDAQDRLSLESETPNARRAHTPNGSVCTVFLGSYPRIGIDTVIVGGPATAADFSYDILASGGATAASGVVDPATAGCTLPTLGANCSDSRLIEGTYSMQANAVAASYVLTSWVCTTGGRQIPSAAFGSFTHSTGDLTDTLCTVTYSYATQDISVDLVLLNDNGGTATASDFTIEIRDASNTVVASGTDPEPGTGNASAVFTVPLGEYAITVTGPDGYEITVETTVVDRAADIVATELFSITATQTVTGVVTANDLLQATTTTTTTTTTVAPTTTDGGDVLPDTGQLPRTGSTSSTPIALAALLFVLFGAGAVVATRRN